MAGVSNGTITGCYVTGEVTGDTGASRVGGLIGENHGKIHLSYSMATVIGRNGGVLAGRFENNSEIISCYATGSVSGNYAGGLAGYSATNTTIKNNYAIGAVSGSGRVGGLYGDGRTRDNHITAGTADHNKNYFDKDTTGQSSPYQFGASHQVGRNHNQGKTTVQLQTPTDYTGIYETWDDFDIDGDGNIDAPWDFGTSTDYPALKIDFNGDGTATVEEFGKQRQ